MEAAQERVGMSGRISGQTR